MVNLKKITHGEAERIVAATYGHNNGRYDIILPESLEEAFASCSRFIDMKLHKRNQQWTE